MCMRSRRPISKRPRLPKEKSNRLWLSLTVLEFNEMLDPPEIASDLTPVLAILILLLPLETLIPLPAVIVDSANPLDEPINNCPLDIEEVFRPVPPYALLIILPCHVPELIVPTVCRLDAEVRLLSVSIAVSIVVSVTASMLSIPFNEQLPPLSEITLVEPTVKSPPLIVKSPVSEKLFLIVVVPLVAPSVRLVAAPPMFNVVAVPVSYTHLTLPTNREV